MTLLLKRAGLRALRAGAALSLALAASAGLAVFDAPEAAARNLSKAFNGAAASGRGAALAGRSSRVATPGRAGSFNDAATARTHTSRVDAAGGTHFNTTKMARDPAHPGMRFNSRGFTTPDGRRYKTSTIIDHRNRVQARRSTGADGGFLKGATREAFGE